MNKLEHLQQKLEWLKQSEIATNNAWRANEEKDYEDSYMHRAQSISKQIGEVMQQIRTLTHKDKHL